MNAIYQGYLFAIFIINGILIGVLFDIFRILRKSFKTPDIITYIEDIVFWIVSGITILYSIFVFNNGEIRLYIFVGILLGIIFYILTISRYFIKINVKIITTTKLIIYKIFEITFYPLKLILRIIKKTLFKPISFIFINCRLFSTKMLKKTKYLLLNVKKSKNNTKSTMQKKDFNV